ncbi:M81 family metallopeptidase [Kitasatospora sp. NPDC093806]|uniref:M81 family metallopeptidase n=1 Tax=Kitasatospora sp. NPDC093806 TaxID=3155075 RepID=UPI0034339D47
MSAPPLRAVVGGLVHESSTFMVEYLGTAGLDAFDRHRGRDMLDEFSGTAAVTGGYLAACAEAGVEAVPALHARAEPGPAVAGETYRQLESELVDAVREAGDCGIVLLDLHGAGVVHPTGSLDLAVLRAVRARLPDAVIAVTMDLHANVAGELVDLADVVTGFHRYPHTDSAERAALAARSAIAAARGEIRPVARFRRVPLQLPPSPTVEGFPGSRLMELAKEVERLPGVLSCTAFHGFPYADTEQAAASVVVVTDGDARLAEECCARLARWLEEHRELFRLDLLEPAEAVRAALESKEGTVVIGDSTDNPGLGAPGDSTHLLRALLAVPEPTCLATLWDPPTVAAAVRAGVGATVPLRLGGRHGWASGPPVEAVGTVRAITDGVVVGTAMRKGNRVDFGTCARVTVGATEVIVASQRRQVLDPEILRLHGIVPERQRVIGVKSSSHFRAGFADVAGLVLVADAPGPTTRRIESIPRSGPSSTLWPMSTRAPVQSSGPTER